ncbi:MAG: hypothetical protein JWM16_2523, partial [Verrucomicrobiales bacterium]|nr:hypothetical protein [Verrucomicrobiales bacterium]
MPTPKSFSYCGLIVGTLAALLFLVHSVSASSLDYFAWDSIPAKIEAGVPFAARLSARDPEGNLAVGFSGEVKLSVFGSEVAPGLVVSEIAIERELVEIANVGT